MAQHFAKRIRFRNGERLSVLQVRGGLPVHEATLFLDGYRRQGRAAGAAAVGLPIWDKPAAACLSSRIPFGTSVTRERLAQIGGFEPARLDVGVAADVAHDGPSHEERQDERDQTPHQGDAPGGDDVEVHIETHGAELTPTLRRGAHRTGPYRPARRGGGHSMGLPNE